MTLPAVTNPRIYENDELELVSVSEALRTHVGSMRVKGTMTSLTKLFKMISGVRFYCDKCMKLNEVSFPQPVLYVKPVDRKCSCKNTIDEVNYDYSNVVIVELQDLEAFNDLERLSVFLFDRDTENIRVGENVLIKGQIQINESPNGGRKLLPYFYAESIQYDRSQKVMLTEIDIASITKFVDKYEHESKVIDELVKMFDNSILDYEYVKRGLLLSAVNSSADTDISNKTRERIHCLLIGPPGLAKSKILRSATKLIPNSRYESGGRNSSGKSLTAIVSKEDETYVLRLGPIPLSKNLLCAINEFGRTDYEDQAHFLDVMEEGEFTINKHGINAIIKSPTTILASANPINNSSWLEDGVVDLNEIPALKPIIDRFDLIFVLRSIKDAKQIADYAYGKAALESKKIPDYSNYLIKHLEYAKTINPTMTDEAKSMLSEFFIKIRTEGFGSNRIFDTLFRLTKAFARLKLKNVADVDDAKEAIEFYNVGLQQYQQTANVPTNPRNEVYDQCIEILKESEVGVSLETLFKEACDKNEYVKRYLCFGNQNLRLRHNIKARSVYQMLINHTNIKRVQEKPVVLQWYESNTKCQSKPLCDTCDPCDSQKVSVENRTYEKSVYGCIELQQGGSGTDSQLSHISHGSHKRVGPKINAHRLHKREYNSLSIDGLNSLSQYPPKCYYCNVYFDGVEKKVYERHVITKHPGKTGYPGPADIKFYEIEPQGMWWEI